MDELLLFTIDEPITALQTNRLLLTNLIDELSPQHRWTSSYYLLLTSPSLHFKHTGSFLQFLLTSPSLHFKQTGSFLQFSLTSSPLNPDGRALTIYVDEPSTAYQTDGLLLTILIGELSPQPRWTSSCYLH